MKGWKTVILGCEGENVSNRPEKEKFLFTCTTRKKKSFSNRQVEEENCNFVMQWSMICMASMREHTF
jgi:hypothetical protein